MTDVSMDPRLILAEMLVGMGITTYSKVKGYLAQNSDDDAALAADMTELDARLTRRGIVIPPEEGQQ